ncbi:hypothetical protein ABW19_dt0202410 [Dactylella cylindrospora]|nr:hypothetical protein ABW19_dt0202410 [Dactylella cylindrospora]
MATLIGSLFLFTASVSGLLINVIPLSASGSQQGATLRLCRPAQVDKDLLPVAIDPSAGTCPQFYVHWWDWAHGSPDRVSSNTGKALGLINLVGEKTQYGNLPALKNSKDYNTKFQYGIWLERQTYLPSQFKVKRGTVYQEFKINGQVEKGDTLEFTGPTSPQATDLSIKLQSQGKEIPYLARQLTDGSGKLLANSGYQTVILQVADLGNTEIVAVQSWWQRGANWLGNVASSTADRAKGAYNSAVTVASPYLDKAANSINNTLNNVTAGLASAGQYVENQASTAKNWATKTAGEAYDAAGNKLNSLVDKVTPVLAAAGQYVGDKASQYGTAVVNTAAKGYNALASPGQTLQSVDESLNRLSESIADKLDKVLDAVASGTLPAVTGYQNIKQGVSEALALGWNNAKNIASNQLNKATNAVTGFLGLGSSQPQTAATTQATTAANRAALQT